MKLLLKKLFNYASISPKPQKGFFLPCEHFRHLSPDKHPTRVWVRLAGLTKSLLPAYPAHSNAYPPGGYRTLLPSRLQQHRPTRPGLPDRGVISAFQAAPDNPGHSGNAGNVIDIAQPHPQPENVCLAYPQRLALCNAKLPGYFPVSPANAADRQSAIHRLYASHFGQNPSYR